MRELTIIIVNWNTKEDVCACLESIRGRCSAQRVTTVVVDNASADGSAEAIAELFPEVALIKSGGNLGFGKANNIGIKTADTPYIMFLNPDTVVQGNAVGAMIDFLSDHPEVAAVQCKQKYQDGEPQTLCLQWEYNPFTLLLEIGFVNDQIASRFRNVFSYHDPNISGYMKTIAGGCMMVRKETLNKIGGFDERFFMYAEDGDMCRRIRNAGGKIYYLADESILHGLGKSSIKAGGDFSILMKFESYHKLMGKYYGYWGQTAFRLGILFIGISKSTILAILNILKKRPQEYQATRSHRMIKWALYLSKARIKH